MIRTLAIAAAMFAASVSPAFAQRAVVRENKLDGGYLRPLTWIGSEKLGVSPKGNTIHLMVAAWAWGAYLGEEGMKRGIRVKTSSYTRHHVNITMTQAKTVSNYTNSILANMEATDDGYDEAACLASAEVSASVTPGLRRMPISSVPSLKGGRKVVAKNGTVAAARRMVAAPVVSAARGRESTPMSAPL